MYKRISVIVTSFMAVCGITLGIGVTPASASTTLPAYTSPVNAAHPLDYVKLPATYQVYVVKSGNTLSGIAHKFNVNWKKLYCANRKVIGSEPSLIQPRMKLKIRETNRKCHVREMVTTPVTVTTTSTTEIPPAQTGPISTSGYGSFQQCVIMAESGGNPRAYNPSSGASGLYGFLLSTWNSLGLGYPGGAYTAPVSVQNQGFAIEYARAGTAPWAPYDGC